MPEATQQVLKDGFEPRQSNSRLHPPYLTLHHPGWVNELPLSENVLSYLLIAFF